YERPRPAGVGAGLKIALFGGGAAVLLMALCCGVVAVIAVANMGPSNERSWNLNTSQHKSWAIPFKQGDQVDIRVTSVGDSDMDLFVFDNKMKMETFLRAKNLEGALGMCLKYDNGPSKDCHVTFTAPATQDYYILLVNRDTVDNLRRNGRNSGKLV